MNPSPHAHGTDRQPDGAAGPAGPAGPGTEDRALVRALFGQGHIGLVVCGPDLRIRRASLRPEWRRAPGSREPRPLRGLRTADLVVPQDASAIEERLRRVLVSGEPLTGWQHSARPLAAPGEERMVSLSAFRLSDEQGRAVGVAAVFTDVTEQYVARQRLRLLYDAATRVGRTLDITRNAEELTAILVPAFADLASIDLSGTVFEGREADAFVPGTRLRRTAVASADGVWPAGTYQVGDTVRARESESENLRGGGSVLVPDMAAWREELEIDEERLRLLFPEGVTSALFVPLYARGNVLGVLGLWRRGARAPYAPGDVPLIEEIASRAALSLENARRYTSELRTVETLQRSLLPPAGMELSAAETAGTYVSAGTASGVGGCWYDVVELSSCRVAFVIGDVAGHGLGAAATMGRLQTAVQTLADLDLAPEELLTRLDDLVIRLAATEPQQPQGPGAAAGTRCLYCVYDPVTGRCVMASAGHPAPLLAGPDGRTRPVELAPGPALGAGGQPFEPVELYLEPGSVLVFATDALLCPAGPGPGPGPGLLPDGAAADGRPPAEIARELLGRVLTAPLSRDAALLVTRVRALPEDATAHWEFAADPAVVARARDLAAARLAAWGLEELAFTTELIVSELVTNAVRYAGGPIGLRLIRDGTLICEVSDPSQTQPHLRRARLTDEGGRGLFLIAQLTRRWGSRYTATGKAIWAEQPLPGEPPAPAPAAAPASAAPGPAAAPPGG
ncbi:SpoIIE family protein phosphatase [Streptomyces sp. YIM 98790]|uniref:SpoIIE family protein phosphatase n=1 Tax=Streptomyces sp. YIM 98790 TaxID=2689077 RepID=UPI00140AFEFC|nr:SpoIIE family protein phosphatase [Streptomyces sp. YIM 98790]